MSNFQDSIPIGRRRQLQYRQENLIDSQPLHVQIKIIISLVIILIMESKTQVIHLMKSLKVFY